MQISIAVEINPIRELDEPSAALRILLLFSNKSPEGITIMTLYDAMSEQGVGRTAVDTSRRALLKAGLTEESQMKNDKNRTVIVVSYTQLGCEVTNKIKEIQEILNNIR
jgi:hypothetical protein